MTGSPGGRRVYLVTGATGFLGKVLLHELVRRSEELGLERLLVLVRSHGSIGAERRFRRVTRAACFADLPAGWTDRVEVVEGDVTRPDCGVAPKVREALAGRVTHILHCAASVQFDLPLAEAAEANVAGALNVLELARSCQQLEALVSVSTAYVTPHPGDRVAVQEELAPLPGAADEIHADILRDAHSAEAWQRRSGHPNTYTFTKCLAEHLLSERRGSVPLVLVRPSIISASWRRPVPGWIDSAAAFAAFVALIGSGHLRAVVGDPESRLNLVPADWVAQRIVEASLKPPEGREVPIHHAAAAPTRAPSIGLCRDRIVDYFRENPSGRSASVRYIGPGGLRFRLAHGLHHQLPLWLAARFSRRGGSRERQLLSQLAQINAVFPYFTTRTFEFQSSGLLVDPAFDPADYVDTVCAGVARHLLRRANR